MEGGIDLTAELELASGDLHDPDQRAAVERALTAIEGITSVRIVPGFGRAIDELHAIATQDRDIKPLVRDIQSLLMARFDLPIDHRVISVVQLDEHDRAAGTRRVVMSAVAVRHEGLGVSAQVTIAEGERRLEGRSEGPGSAFGRQHATARATLEAVRPLIAEQRTAEIQGVDVTHTAGHEIAICVIHLHSNNGQDTAVGSAIVTRDESDAIARAVLDALNRWLVPS
ncbi:MAG: hypothetical protein R3343_09350 [Nitriliruptorales bacterium]|nr:hypothetical protein [Nitriliruptorales bacterium]